MYWPTKKENPIMGQSKLSIIVMHLELQLKPQSYANLTERNLNSNRLSKKTRLTVPQHCCFLFKGVYNIEHLGDFTSQQQKIYMVQNLKLFNGGRFNLNLCQLESGLQRYSFCMCKQNKPSNVFELKRNLKNGFFFCY